MNKIRVNTRMFLLLILSYAIIASCSKESGLVNTEDSMKNTQKSLEPDATESKIIAFIEQMDQASGNPELEQVNGWYYKVEDALWNLEAAYNYKYAYPNEQRSKLVLDTLFLTVTKNSSGLIGINSMSSGFNEALELLKNQFDKLEASKKFFVSMDMEVLSENSTQVQFVCRYYFGVFDVTLDDGDWKYEGGDWGNGGICGTNQFLNYDGTHKLEQELFLSNPNGHKAGYYYTNISIIWIAQNLIPGQSINYSFNYSPYTCDVLPKAHYYMGNHPTCISFSHMNVYKANIIPVIQIVENNYNKYVIVEDFMHNSALVNYPVEPFFIFYDLHLSIGKSYPRIYNPSDFLTT